MLEIDSPVRTRKPMVTTIQLAIVVTSTTARRLSSASGAVVRKAAARSEPAHAHAGKTTAFAMMDHLTRLPNESAVAEATMLASRGLVKMALAVVTIALKLSLPRSSSTLAAFVRVESKSEERRVGK